MSPSDDALLRELTLWWGWANGQWFGGRLRPPVIRLDATARLGAWISATRTLSLSWSLVVDQPWGRVLEVLKHEMAHQYVHEVLGVTDEPPHGPSFQRVCRERGLDARAAGLPDDAEDPRAARVARKVRKLLALADSPHEAEARAALRAARRLMLRHNLDAVDAGWRRDVTTATVGRPRKRVPKHEQMLAGLLGAHFFVEVTRVPSFDVARHARGHVHELCGTPDNVEVAAWVYGTVLETVERLWEAHRRAHGLSGARAANRYKEGVVLGFADQLRDEAAAAEQTGLVWAGDPAVRAFVDRRWHGRRARRGSAVQVDATTRAGRDAGRQLRLRRPIRERRAGRQRALPGPVGHGTGDGRR